MVLIVPTLSGIFGCLPSFRRERATRIKPTAAARQQGLKHETETTGKGLDNRSTGKNAPAIK
jgi:hypothetical protein